VGDPGDRVPADGQGGHHGRRPGDQGRPAARPVLPVANFEEEVFDEPEGFDIARSPNPHLEFGGTGAHCCVGANLARLEIDLIFNAIAAATPGIRQAGEAERLRSGWLNGIKRLPVSYG